MDLLDELWSLDATLQQRVDEHDVGPHLADRGDRPGALGQDFEQLDPGLGFEETANVLSDLRDVLDDQQARLVTWRHRLDDTTRVGSPDPSGVPVDAGESARRSDVLAAPIRA